LYWFNRQLCPETNKRLAPFLSTGRKKVEKVTTLLTTNVDSIILYYMAPKHPVRSEEKRMQTTVFQLGVEAHEALRNAAHEERISMGEALRRAVEMWLKAKARKKEK
jgi:hypothetical protein